MTAPTVKINETTVLVETHSQTLEYTHGRAITTKTFIVVVDGVTIGSVSSHYSLGYRKIPGSRLVKPTAYRLRWSGTPRQVEGEAYRRGYSDFTSRKDAVDYVLKFA